MESSECDECRQVIRVEQAFFNSFLVVRECLSQLHHRVRNDGMKKARLFDLTNRSECLLREQVWYGDVLDQDDKIETVSWFFTESRWLFTSSTSFCPISQFMLYPLHARVRVRKIRWRSFSHHCFKLDPPRWHYNRDHQVNRRRYPEYIEQNETRQNNIADHSHLAEYDL